METPKELARFGFWTEEVYNDLLACQKGTISKDTFKSKYKAQIAILCLDIAGFTKKAIMKGELYSLFRILDVQKVCGPIFYKFNARRIRAFADNFTVLFDDANDALMAAIEVHQRIRSFNQSEFSGEDPAQCCIGIGYGQVYTLGVDQAMGSEMNRASKLGEDIARGEEILLTEQAYEELKERKDCIFRRRVYEKILPGRFYFLFPELFRSLWTG